MLWLAAIIIPINSNGGMEIDLSTPFGWVKLITLLMIMLGMTYMLVKRISRI